MAKKIILFALFVFLAGTGFYFIYGPKSEKNAQTPPPNDNSPSSGLRIGTEAIYVPDQKPGPNITVGFANIKKNGFVVIHESSGGAPGAIIGNSILLNAGENENITISLLRPSKNGDELIAMLHHDDGNALFNAPGDLPAKDSDGNILYMIFSVYNDADAPDAINL
ncbi:MAG: hypothetical protein HY445_01285 [Candidatus Niyogibacteria bacterium]|nr:hypothetical protein [Candidatus Niyogibacteria bacterium]